MPRFQLTTTVDAASEDDAVDVAARNGLTVSEIKPTLFELYRVTVTADSLDFIINYLEANDAFECIPEKILDILRDVTVVE